jgi:hypothetical protein
MAMDGLGFVTHQKNVNPTSNVLPKQHHHVKRKAVVVKDDTLSLHKLPYLQKRSFTVMVLETREEGNYANLCSGNNGPLVTTTSGTHRSYV